MRAFLIAIALGLAALAWLSGMLAMPVNAETTHTWGSPFYASTITILPTDKPGAVAEVVFDNRTVHPDEKSRFDLTLGDLTVTVIALVGRGLTPDRMTIIPPDGYFADPPEIDVAEDAVGRVVLYPYLGF
jgi:hypothetical protein